MSQALPQLFELLKNARKILECPRKCDAACQACLLTYETQHHEKLLNRNSALALLEDRYLQAFELPTSLQIFGSASCLEMEPLTIALQREFQHFEVKEIRIYAYGDAKLWEPLDWIIRDFLLRIQATGCDIKLIISEHVLESLLPSQCDELAALAALAKIKLFRDPETVNATKQIVTILEIGSNKRKVCWASTKLEATSLNPKWGSGTDDALFVRGRSDETLNTLNTKWKEITPSELRQPEGNLFSISITNEFDGPIESFGARAWAHIFSLVPELEKLLENNQPLSLVSYTDRYLRSPIVLRLLREFLRPLSEYPGGINQQTNISIYTSSLPHNNSQNPRLIFHDWRNTNDRRDVLGNILAINTAPQLFENRNNEVSHAREMNLIWQDGAKYKIRFDQGMGYWYVDRHSDVSFPFDRSTDIQTRRLLNVSINIKANFSNYPTYCYIGRA